MANLSPGTMKKRGEQDEPHGVGSDGERGYVSGVALQRVGEITLADLAAICRLQGQDGLPYPFAHTTRKHEQHHHRISSVASRLADGDLSAFRDWTDAYVGAEIWVTCRVHHSADTPDRRILAHSKGESGYLACQRSNDDVIEVSTLSAADVGAAIAGAVGLTEPGTHARIVVPGYVDYFAHQTATDRDNSDNDEIFSVRDAVHQPSPPTHSVVADEDVRAIATIQSLSQPPRGWGVDWTKNVISCVQIDADGDYIYTPDFSHAVPLTKQLLSERINRSIDEDTAALPLQRRL